MTFNGQTVLNFYEMGGVPLFSMRDASQTLHPIGAAADLARTVNGTLVDLSDEFTFRKFASEISCTDWNVPAFDGFWPGMVLTVDCVAELCYATGGSPSRPVVSGSSYVVGGFTVYRPTIVFRIIDWSVSFKEWASETTTQLSLEEV